MAEQHSDTLRQDVIRCAVCGRNHIGVLFNKFHGDVDLDAQKWPYFAHCPTNGRTIYMRFDMANIPRTVEVPDE